MLLQAAKDLDIDLAASWMIGDSMRDVEAGQRAGCRAILLNAGGATETDKAEAGETGDKPRRPDFVASELAEAAVIVLRYGKIGRG